LSWNQLIIQISNSDVEEISDWLTSKGALAVTFEDAKDNPILEPDVGDMPLWDVVNLTALFEETDPVAKVSQQLEQKFTDKIRSIKTATLKDQQWERVWMDDFKAMQFGKNLWVCPSWQQIPHPDAVNLILDPGLAFGSGTHETTALCLEWLESETLDGKIVIDYGCGSGILAIAAIKLGAHKAIGTDNDPQAMLASRENAQRNQISPRQLELIHVGNDKAPSINSADVLVANILAQPLRLLAKELVSKVHSGGKIALSGLLTEQAQEIMDIYQGWIRFNPVMTMGNWCLVSGVKK